MAPWGTDDEIRQVRSLRISKAEFEAALRAALFSDDFRGPFLRLSTETRRLIVSHDIFHKRLDMLVINKPGPAWEMCESLGCDLTWDRELHEIRKWGIYQIRMLMPMLNSPVVHELNDNDDNVELLYRTSKLSKQTVFHVVASTCHDWDLESLTVLVGAYNQYTRFRPSRVKLILDHTDLSKREAHLITDFLWQLPTTDPVNQKDRRGYTPIFRAIDNWPGNSDAKQNSSGIALVQLLLEAGAKADDDVLTLVQQQIESVDYESACCTAADAAHSRMLDDKLAVLLEVQSYLVSAPRFSR